MVKPGRPPLDTNGPLTGGERQARYRARQAERQPPPVVRYKRPADRRSRPEQWREAVDTLTRLQAEYQAWLDRLPPSLADTPTAAALEAVCDLDLSALEVDPPKGFGRD